MQAAGGVSATTTSPATKSTSKTIPTTAAAAPTAYYDYDYISDVSSTRLDYNSTNPAIMSTAEFDAHKCHRNKPKQHHHHQQQQQHRHQSHHNRSHHEETSSRNSRSLHHSPYNTPSTTTNLRTNSVGSKPGSERRELKYVTFSNEYLNSAQSDAFKIISFQDDILNKFQTEAFTESSTAMPTMSQQHYHHHTNHHHQPPRPKSAVIALDTSTQEYFYTSSSMPDYMLNNQNPNSRRSTNAIHFSGL